MEEKCQSCDKKKSCTFKCTAIQGSQFLRPIVIAESGKLTDYFHWNELISLQKLAILNAGGTRPLVLLKSKAAVRSLSQVVAAECF